MYTCILYIYIYTYPPSHCHDGFMATRALGHTHVRLHVGIQDPKKAQVNTRATSLIIHTNRRT